MAYNIGQQVYLLGGGGPVGMVVTAIQTNGNYVVSYNDSAGNAHKSELTPAQLTSQPSGVSDAIAGQSGGGNLRQVRAVATANQTLTGSATIDGVVLATGDRLLCVNQTVASQNGIYVVSTTGAWQLAADWATGSVIPQTRIVVAEGTAWGGSEWYVQTTGAITVGTTSVAMYPARQKGTSAAMTAGSITISNVWLAAGAQIVLTENTLGGTAGDLKSAAASRTAGAGNGSFIIVSSSGTDTSTVDWLIINV